MTERATRTVLCADRADSGALAEIVAARTGAEATTTPDGLIVAFASAVDAVACAVHIQRTLARHGQPVARIGLSVGEADHDDGAWSGAPVTEASELCRTAGDGQILVSPIVAALVRTRGQFAFVDRGGVVEVTWALGAPALPLPYAVSATAHGPFVGRVDPSEQLADTWKQGGGVVLVSGEPGIGKTRVVAELATRVHGEGGAVLWGRCDEDLGVPYQPFVEALGFYVNHAPVEHLEEAEPAGDLLRLVPELKEKVPGVGPPILADPDAERIQMFDAVAAFLAGVARSAPVLLVIDDLQWAAKTSVMLLRHLARAGQQPAGVVIAATYRDTDLAADTSLNALLDEFDRRDDVVRVALDGLGPDEVAAYVEATGADAAIAAAVHRETEGNPFFVGEVLRDRAEGGMPEAVRDVVQRRLDRLSDHANRVLSVAAAVGPEVDLAVLERIPEFTAAGPVLAGLKEAAAARLVAEVPSPPGRYVFTHALVRQALYSQLSSARRTRLHLRIGETIEAMPARDVLADRSRTAALAHHYLEGAAAGGVEKAVEWAARAAAEARDRLAYEEESVYRERALQLYDRVAHPNDERRVQLLVDSAIALRDVGALTEIRARTLELADAARRTGNKEALAIAASTRVNWATTGVVDEETDALIAEAIEAMDEESLHFKAELIHALVFHRAVYQGMGWSVAPLMDEGLAVARATGRSEVVARLLCTQAFMLQGSPDLDAQQAVFDELDAVLESVPDDLRGWISRQPVRRYFTFLGLRHWPVVALQRGDVVAFERGLEEMRGCVGVPGLWLAWPMSIMWTAMRALMDGRVDDAEAESNKLLEFTVDTNFFNFWAAQMFAINRERGTLAAVRGLFADAAAGSPGILAIQAVVGLVASEVGDLDEAGAVLHRLMADPASTMRPNNALPLMLPALATMAVRTREADVVTVEALLDALRPYTGQLLVVAWGVICEGAADRYIGMLLALLGRTAEAADAYEAALALERRVGAAPFVARTEEWYSQLRS